MARSWDTSTGRSTGTPLEHKGSVSSVAFSPDGKTLAAGGGVFDSEGNRWTSGEAKLWDVATGKERLTIKRHTDVIAALAFAPDGQTLVTGGADALVKLWDANSGEERTALLGHSGRVTAVAFSPDGKTLASAGDDRTVKLWVVAWEKR
jgi:WD40 repeat protein